MMTPGHGKNGDEKEDELVLADLLLDNEWFASGEKYKMGSVQPGGTLNMSKVPGS